MIYLDHNATTPLDKRVLDAMLPYLTDKYGNPSSKTHVYGWDAAYAVEQAREHVARLINCRPNNIIFTSGATESNNIALNQGRRIATSTIEHSSVYNVAALNDTTVWFKPDGAGIIHVFDGDFDIASVMYVNNEIGVTQDLNRIRAMLPNKLLHSDMAQALGKIQINVAALDVDFASFSAHKVYGPKGVGALYCKNPDIIPLMRGGSQEMGVRPGTLNVPAIVGFGEACRIAYGEFNSIVNTLSENASIMEQMLCYLSPEIRINNYHNMVPGMLHLTLPCDNIEMFFHVIGRKVALSASSACLSLTNDSRVLSEIGMPSDEARRSIRLCVGKFNEVDELYLAAKHIANAIRIAMEV